MKNSPGHLLTVLGHCQLYSIHTGRDHAANFAKIADIRCTFLWFEGMFCWLNVSAASFTEVFVQLHMWSGGIIIMASVVVSSSLLKSFKRKNKKSSKLNIFNKVIKYNMVVSQNCTPE